TRLLSTIDQAVQQARLPDRQPNRKPILLKGFGTFVNVTLLLDEQICPLIEGSAELFWVVHALTALTFSSRNKVTKLGTSYSLSSKVTAFRSRRFSCWS